MTGRPLLVLLAVGALGAATGVGATASADPPAVCGATGTISGSGPFACTAAPLTCGLGTRLVVAPGGGGGGGTGGQGNALGGAGARDASTKRAGLARPSLIKGSMLETLSSRATRASLASPRHTSAMATVGMVGSSRASESGGEDLSSAERLPPGAAASASTDSSNDIERLRLATFAMLPR